MTTRWTGLAACVLALQLGAGCQERPPPAEVLTRLPDGLPHSSGALGWQALVSGRVSIANGCLLVGDNLVVWPHGTRWAEGEGEMALPDGVTLSVGDFVEGAGGYVAPGRRQLRAIADPATIERVVACSRRVPARQVAVLNSYAYGPVTTTPSR